MAGTVSFTYDDGYDGAGRVCGIRRVICNWTSTAGGAASDISRKIVGRLVKAVTIPTDGPTDNYDITITDENSVDVLANCKTGLANRDTVNTEEQYFLVLNNDTSALSMAVHPVVCSQLTFSVANAGNAKSGQIVLYYIPV